MPDEELHAMISDSINRLDQSIMRLEEKMEDGFGIMHAKQDLTNGKVLKSISDIINIESRLNQFDLNRATMSNRRFAVFMAIFGVGTSVATAFLSSFLR